VLWGWRYSLQPLFFARTAPGGRPFRVVVLFSILFEIQLIELRIEDAMRIGAMPVRGIDARFDKAVVSPGFKPMLITDDFMTRV